MHLIVTSSLGNCSSCTGICYLGNPLHCNRIGCLGNLPSCTVERDFCHRSVVWDHDYHVTIQVYPDWILDDQGNHAWNHSAEGMSSTERAAHSWRECRDEKDPLCENWQKKREKAVIKMPRLKENNVYRFLQMRYQKFLDYTRSRSLQTTTSSLELAFHEEVLLARHAILPNAWRTAKFVCVGGYNRVACWKLQSLDSGMQCKVRERGKKGEREAVFSCSYLLCAVHTISSPGTGCLTQGFSLFFGKKHWGRDYTQTWGPGLCFTSTYSLSLFFVWKKDLFITCMSKKKVESMTQSHHQVPLQNNT